MREIARQYVRDLEIPGGHDEELLEAALRQLTAVLGASIAEKILAWECHSYEHYPVKGSLAWHALFKSAFDDNFQGGRLEPPALEPRIHRALRSIITQHRSRIFEIQDKFAQHQAAIEAEVLAVWGEPLAVYGPRYYSPLDWMHLQVSFVDRMGTWKKLQAVLSDEARATLEAWGEEQGRKYGLLQADKSLPLVQPPDWF